MMSENSSSINFMTLQKNIFKRRKWLVILAFLVFILYNAVFIGIRLSNHDISGDGMPDQVKYLFGNQGFNSIITIVGAVLLGIEGFYWLDSRTRLDFYESQPVSRNAHFFGIVINSTVIYTVSYLVSLLLGFIVAGIGHALNLSVISTAFVAFVRNLFLYFSVFSFSVLAIMLTGNIVVAVIADAVLLTYEIMFDLSINSCLGYIVTMPNGTFFSTHGIFSPLSTIRNYMRTGEAIGHNIFMGIVVLLIAWLLYRNRKAEFAGNSVPYRLVRYITKIAVIFICCIVAALVITGGSRYQTGPVCLVIIMLITMIVVGGVMEAIYNSDVKKIFKGFGYSVIGCAAALVLFLGFYFDITGYNHWVPDASQVSSAYITSDSNMEDFKSEYSKKYMKLTDIDTINTLLSIGEETAVNGESEDCIYGITIYYRMKNGQIKGRKVNIPVSCKDSLNKILSSEEFKEGWFRFYHDESLASTAKHFTITYYNGDSTDFRIVNDDMDTYNRIKEAYIRDLANYDFSLAGYHVPVGTIEVQKMNKNLTGNDYGEGAYTYPVYKDFTNTLAVLKDSGLYVSTKSSADDSESIMALPFYVNTGKAQY